MSQQQTILKILKRMNVTFDFKQVLTVCLMPPQEKAPHSILAVPSRGCTSEF